MTLWEKLVGRNTDPFRRSLYEGGGYKDVVQWLAENGITPGTHPYACDLFSGDGAGALAFVKSGWHPNAITCIDHRVSNLPLVPAARFHYVDLRCILNSDQDRIDETTASMAGQFDVIVAVNDWWPHKSRLQVARFFARSGGAIYYL
ncbi:MAG: hypothetical protein AAB481_02945 [Patescibacteria group bacterium]